MNHLQLEFFSTQGEFSRILGRKVGLATVAALSPYYKDEVLSEAQVQYGAS